MANHPSIGLVIGDLIVTVAFEYQTGNTQFAVAEELLAVSGIWYPIWWTRFVSDWHKESAADMRKIRRELYEYDPEEVNKNHT